MNSLLSYMVHPMDVNDFLRGPDFDSISFLEGLYAWALGVVLAIVVVWAVFKAATALIGLAGADSHRARGVGEAFAFSAIAVVIALLFADLFGSLISSIR